MRRSIRRPATSKRLQYGPSLRRMAGRHDVRDRTATSTGFVVRGGKIVSTDVWNDSAEDPARPRRPRRSAALIRDRRPHAAPPRPLRIQPELCLEPHTLARNGARLAVYLGLKPRTFRLRRESGRGTRSRRAQAPGVLNYAWRGDWGNPCWRLGVRARHAKQARDARRKRDRQQRQWFALRPRA